MRLFFEELKRRNVFRVAVVYLATSWLLIQLAETLFPIFGLSDALIRLIVILLTIGFPLFLIFSWLYELTPEGLKLEREVERSASLVRHTGKQLDRGIIVVLTLVLVSFAVDKFVLDPTRDARREETAATRARSDALVESFGDNSIVVLPFVNMSDDASNEYFSDGISEELLNLLAAIPQLRVISRSSAFSFKGKDIDIPTLAEHLNVTHVLEGSVRKAGNRVRITTQLIDARSDTHLWSENYNAELSDIFAVQDEIAQRIVEALKVRLNPGEPRVPESNRTSSRDAYDFYLRGQSHYLRTTREGFIEAQEMYTKAIEIDPSYAPAYGALANVHSHYFNAYEADAKHLAQADALSQKAVDLAPDLARAHVARGIALTANQRYQEAEEALETASQLDPRSVSVYYFYGLTTFKQGKYERTAQLWEKVLELDPNHKQAWTNLPMVYRRLGRDNDALQAYRQSAELIEKSLKINPNDINELIRLATARLVLGEREKALASTERVLKMAADDAILLYNAACIYSLAGETDKALETLELSIEAGFADPTWMEQDSDLDHVRDNPRFNALLERIRTSP